MWSNLHHKSWTMQYNDLLGLRAVILNEDAAISNLFAVIEHGLFDHVDYDSESDDHEAFLCDLANELFGYFRLAVLPRHGYDLVLSSDAAAPQYVDCDLPRLYDRYSKANIASYCRKAVSHLEAFPGRQGMWTVRHHQQMVDTAVKAFRAMMWSFSIDLV